MNPTLEISIPRYNNLKVTREEYLDLPEDGFKYDMEEGVLHLSPSPGFEHADRTTQLIFRIGAYLSRNPIAKVVSECDVLLPDGGDVLRPDITVILMENMGIVKNHIHGTPDLVVEVLSPSTRHKDLTKKADRYLQNGVKEYWIVDPESKEIEVWHNEKSTWNKKKGSELQSLVLPELLILSKDIFS